MINRRLTEDKLIATKIQRDKTAFKRAKDTWEKLLEKQGDLPHMWMYNNEVLVGRGLRV